MSATQFFARATVLVLTGVILGTCASPPEAEGCAVILPSGTAPGGSGVRIEGESALIVYNSATKTEHFLRTANFNTDVAHFGFMVPTPSRPDLAEASGAAFSKLETLTAPEVIHRTAYRQAHIECLPAANQTFSQVGSAIKPGGGSVQVVEQKFVGPFMAAVLKADDAQALQGWLKENGYSARPALDAWFAEYVRRGWYIAAFKLQSGGYSTAQNPAVLISFKTDVPIYPYREPAENQASSKPRLLRLFVLSDDRVEGTIGQGENAKAFPGQTVWSKPVASPDVERVLIAGKIPLIYRDWRLTEFEDRSSPRPGSDDLFFSKAQSQDSVARPPRIVWEYKTTMWGEGVVYGLAVILAFGCLLVIRRVAKVNPKPDAPPLGQ